MQSGRELELDGRTLEGGGQLLRLAIGLSALTSAPVKITNIRGNRSAGGGLKAQHLACVNWLAQATDATVLGAVKGSTSLDFQPSELGNVLPAYRLAEDEKTKSKYWESRLDIKSAGSTGLALQAILPFILFRPPRNDDGTPSKIPIRLTISGGTNVSGSPSFEYVAQVLLPAIQAIGLPPIAATLNKRGWSHGGSSIGSFTLEIPARQSLSLPAFQLSPEDLNSNPSLPSHLSFTFIAPAAAHTHFRTILELIIQSYFGPGLSETNNNISITCEDSKHEKRYYLLAVATVPSSSNASASPSTYKLGRDWLYDRRVRSPETTTTELVDHVCNDLHFEWSSGAYVDEHMRDQLVVFQALADGKSKTFGGLNKHGMPREASLHAKTADWVVMQMLGKGK